MCDHDCILLCLISMYVCTCVCVCIYRRSALQNILSSRVDHQESGSTISALWHMRDYVSYVQNFMADILTSVESFKNLLNWTDPNKTMPMYLLLIAGFCCAIFIPSRYLILIGQSSFLNDC